MQLSYTSIFTCSDFIYSQQYLFIYDFTEHDVLVTYGSLVPRLFSQGARLIHMVVHHEPSKMSDTIQTHTYPACFIKQPFSIMTDYSTKPI